MRTVTITTTTPTSTASVTFAVDVSNSLMSVMLNRVFYLLYSEVREWNNCVGARNNRNFLPNFSLALSLSLCLFLRARYLLFTIYLATRCRLFGAFGINNLCICVVCKKKTAEMWTKPGEMGFQWISDEWRMSNVSFHRTLSIIWM